MILRFLNPRGCRHRRRAAASALCCSSRSRGPPLDKQSGRFEQLYRAEQAASPRTVANYRAAAETARAADRANAARVAAAQRDITERTTHEFETRLADARARAPRLRLATPAAADRGGGRSSACARPSRCPRRAAQAAGQNRFPHSDRLIATEQAIQLDELIKWVNAQAAVKRD